MKRLLILLFCFISSLGYSQNFVTGHILYDRGYNYTAGESVRFTYLNKFIDVKIDSVQPSDITSLLKKCGIDSIIYVGVYTSSVDDKVELWFAYSNLTLKTTGGWADVWIQNSHHRYGGFATNNYLGVPQFVKINTDSLKQVCINISKKYNIRSFMIKPWNLPEISLNVLNKGTRNGELADMRYIAGSYNLVNQFKSLNWNNIWYNDITGRPKNIRRPRLGW